MRKHRKGFRDLPNLAELKQKLSDAGMKSQRRPAQQVSTRPCSPCGGNGSLTPGGNKRKTRVCGNCGGKGYRYVGGNAPMGTWF